MTDAARLTADLIRCPSVTPTEGGALVLLADLLTEAGFEVHRVDRNDTPNLFARWGPGARAALASTGIPMWCRRAIRPRGAIRPLAGICMTG